MDEDLLDKFRIVYRSKKKKHLADPSKALLQICIPVYKSRGTLAMVSQLCKIGELQLRRTKDMVINQTRGSMTTLLTGETVSIINTSINAKLWLYQKIEYEKKNRNRNFGNWMAPLICKILEFPSGELKNQRGCVDAGLKNN